MFFNSKISNYLLRTTPDVVLGALVFASFVIYAPVLDGYFLSDDFGFLYTLQLKSAQYVQGEEWYDWFVDFSAAGLHTPGYSIFFRPVTQWLWLTNYIMWGEQAVGYYLINILLHALTCFFLYVIAKQMLRDKVAGIVAALLFALHPIHAGSVAWISDNTDLIGAMFSCMSVTFFILYRQKNRPQDLIASVIAFAAALGSKESTMVLPGILIAFDYLFTPSWLGRTLKTHLYYWLTLIGYIGLRFLLFQRFGGNPGIGILGYGAEPFIQYNLLFLLQPFISDIEIDLAIGLLVFFGIVTWFYRANKAIWFGWLWLLITLLPGVATVHPAPRLVYMPSAGFAIALAALTANLVSHSTRWVRVSGTVVLCLLLLIYVRGISAKVDDWANAGSVTRTVGEQMRARLPTPPASSRLFVIGVPHTLRGVDVYIGRFFIAMRVLYRMPYLDVQDVEKFPIINDELDRAYFFEYRRRFITEHVDIRQMLNARRRCLDHRVPAISWNFDNDTQGWEAWNGMTNFQKRENILFAQAINADPYMASPTFDIPAISIGDVEITMRVVSATQELRGTLYWLASGQRDFWPGIQESFRIDSDGVWHTYLIDLARSGKMFIGDHITRLRLNPVNAPADIEVKSIRVNMLCAESRDVVCKCSP